MCPFSSTVIKISLYGYSCIYIYVHNPDRRHQLCLHPTLNVSPHKLNTLSCGRAGIGHHLLPHIRWFPIWFAASKPEANWARAMLSSCSTVDAYNPQHSPY